MRTIGQEVTYEDFHKNYKFFCQKISRTTDFTEALKIIRELIDRADKQEKLLTAMQNGTKPYKFCIDDYNLIVPYFKGKKATKRDIEGHINQIKKRRKALKAFLKKYGDTDDGQTRKRIK